ncbi:MAG: MBL fold metallo-hydrolase [Spirochaetes bacterium]|jgi:glyoxylase-like metal-dependent hydrolase (beta-lactamase superfamily II)|nr:MBL fold metallo-hydrolase [Spirochaetota bacterium]
MKVRQISTSIYQIGFGVVNAFLIAPPGSGKDITVVDTGMPGSADAILSAVTEIGRKPEDVGRILLTHLHYDHTGSAAELGNRIGVPMLAHPMDAAALREGMGSRPFTPAPRVWARLMAGSMRAIPPTSTPIAVDREVHDGETLVEAADARVIHVPGHAAGQIALLLAEDGGVLIAADAATNFIRLDYPPIFEDIDVGRASLRRLADERFERVCFGHGRPILRGASGVFQRRFAA